jgi:hypothetical protein
MYRYIGNTQNNGAVLKVNKISISHPTRAQHTLSAAGTVQVSQALTAVRFPCLLRGRGASFQDGAGTAEGFLSTRLRCPDLWLQCSVSFVHGLKKTHHTRMCYLNYPRNSRCTAITDLVTLKPSFFFKYPLYLQSVTIHSANGRMMEGWHVEEYSVVLLC